MNKTNGTDKAVRRTYNDHLVSCRVFHRKPFKTRKNFEKFREDPRYRKYVYLTRWFNGHPEINRSLYFEATLFFHRDEEVVPIEEYCKPKALKNYYQYVKMLGTLDLENIKSLTMCVEGFTFIKDYCESFDIDVKDYLTFREEPNYNYAFLKHIKNNQISVYSMFAFSGFNDILKKLYRDSELWTFYLGEKTPLFYLQKYNSSVKYKQLTKQALAKIG